MMLFVTIFTIIIISLNVSAPSNVQKDYKIRWKFDKLLNSIASVNKERLNALKRYTELDKFRVADGILRLSDEHDPMVAVLFLNKRDPAASKLYEIYDGELKNPPGDTPVRDILNLINDYYDNMLENEESEDVTFDIENEGNLEKLYGTNFHIERLGKESSDGEEIIPNKNKVQAKENNNAETSDGEEIGSKRGRNIPDRVTDKAVTSKDIITGKGKIKSNNDSKMNQKQMLRLFKSCNKKAVKICKKACKTASKRVCDTFKCSKSMKKAFKKHCAKECKSKFTD